MIGVQKLTTYLSNPFSACVRRTSNKLTSDKISRRSVDISAGGSSSPEILCQAISNVKCIICNLNRTLFESNYTLTNPVDALFWPLFENYPILFYWFLLKMVHEISVLTLCIGGLVAGAATLTSLRVRPRARRSAASCAKVQGNFWNGIMKNEKWESTLFLTIFTNALRINFTRTIVHLHFITKRANKLQERVAQLN